MLVARDFAYFGRAAITLPERFASLKTGRAVKANFPADVIEDFAAFIAAKGFCIHGTPTLWLPKWGAAGGGVAGGCGGEGIGATAAKCT